ncbi:MAG: flagellar biosynthetic protein FliR [Pirellulales bacterium]|nr:flagellar biosynthetic protein FliR [Pirellulales bacterium]
MDWLNHLDTEKFLVFTLVLTRVSGLMMTAPLYGTKEVPAQVRVLLALVVALLIMPSQWNVALDYPGTTLNYLAIVAGELVVGACMGLGIQLIFRGLELAGELIAYVGGLMMAEALDPTQDANQPLLSRFLYLFALAIYLSLGGHRMVMAGLLDTFQAIPPGLAVFTQSITEAFVTLVAQSFSLAVRASAPAVAALLLAALVVGLIGRTVPQLNVMNMGFALNSCLMFGILSITLGGALWAFHGYLEPALETICNALNVPLHTEWFT